MRTLTPLRAFPAWPENDPFNTGKVLAFASVRAACDHFGKKYGTFAPMVCRAIAKQWKAHGHWWVRTATYRLPEEIKTEAQS